MKTQLEITDELLENYSEAHLALALHLEIDPEDILPERNDIYSVGPDEYLVCDDSTADDYWDEDLENYIDECIIDSLPGMYQQYFDRERWKSDARYDGRAHSLARYDGDENSAIVNDTIYFIYRQN